ncbi:MAG: PDZ domain-containing protein [Ruminococcus sp.]|nr:PDZ domain-containing protein [Ruminococcus sp.]
MNKKISLGLAISLAAVSIAVTFVITSFLTLRKYNRQIVDVNEKGKIYSSLQLLDAQTREKYYGDIDEQELNEGILKGYVNGLGDKFSRYLSKEEYISEKTDNSGESIGLGLTLAQDSSGYMRISDIISDSPAADEGLEINDMITFVGKLDVKKAGFDTSVEAMRGTEGSDITITVRRDGIDKEYTLTRRAMEVKTVTGEMLSGYVGYIQITGFKENTPEQFIDILERLTSNGAENLILDLRDNKGELIEPMAKCIDPLLPEGVAAVAEYKDGHSETVIYSDESEIDIPMIVLVNENTASAAEVFAAALHDAEKAEIIGVQTAGKGVLQETSELQNGSAVILTVAEIKTPSGGSFNNTGITPDYIVENDGFDAQYNKALEIIQLKKNGQT